MASVITSPERSRLMARVRQNGTAPELTVRKLLRQLGYRFSIKGRSLPGSPDIVNRKAKIAIFVHGCFWHRHIGCPYSTTPKTNIAFWRDKFKKNRARDATKVHELRSMRYRVVTIWACQLKTSRGLRGIAQRLARIFENA